MSEASGPAELVAATDRPRVALVTGGARGIGLAIVDRLAAAGMEVVATYLSTDPPRRAERVHWRRVDLADEAGTEQFLHATVDDFGAPSVFVSNAAVLDDGSVLRMPASQFDRVLSIDLAVPARVAATIVPPMAEAGWGRCVFVSSVGGLLGSAGQVNYAAAKAGLCGVSAALAFEYAASGVTSNVVAPGPVDTELLRSLDPRRLAELADAVPAGRLGHPAEVASLVAYLCSEDAGFVTGAVIPVDGGLAAAASSLGRRPPAREAR